MMKQSDKVRARPSRLSDEAIIVGFGWFSFGEKASVTSNPPHANMKARQAALDELLAAELITHEHESEPRYGIDRHHFRGTSQLLDILHSEHGQRVLASAIEARSGETRSCSTEGESAVGDSRDAQKDSQ